MPEPPRTAQRVALFALVIGVLLALGTRALYLLPGDVPFLTRLATPWAATAVVAGGLTPRRRDGAVAGVLALCAAVLVYYAILAFVERDYGASPYGIAWLLAAVPTGALGGAAGALARAHGRRGLRLAVAGIGGALAGELVLWSATSPRAPQLIALAVGALVVVAATALTARRRGEAIAVLVLAALVALATPTTIAATTAVLQVARDGA